MKSHTMQKVLEQARSLLEEAQKVEELKLRLQTTEKQLQMARHNA